MKENGIKSPCYPFQHPSVYFKGDEFPEDFSENLARRTNEIMADAKNKFPESFGGFATIPMLNKQAALEELNYALDELHLNEVFAYQLQG